jgi:hypothetical protein
MDNPDKLTTLGTQDDDKQNKNTARYVLDTTNRKQDMCCTPLTVNTNNVNKTSATLQTTGGRTDHRK